MKNKPLTRCARHPNQSLQSSVISQLFGQNAGSPTSIICVKERFSSISTAAPCTTGLKMGITTDFSPHRCLCRMTLPAGGVHQLSVRLTVPAGHQRQTCASETLNGRPTFLRVLITHWEHMLYILVGSSIASMEPMTRARLAVNHPMAALDSITSIFQSSLRWPRWGRKCC